jgi:hypothetical protein
MDCLVDSNNQIIYGQWKGRPQVTWELRLVCQPLGPAGQRTFSLLLQPNSTASYCLPPGRYQINHIEYSSSDYYLQKSFPLLGCTFDVQPNAINYIGTLHTQYRWTPAKEMAVVPTYIVKHRGMGSSASLAAIQPFGLVGGLIVGVVGGLADAEIRQRASRTVPYHALRILDDSTFHPVFQGKLPIRHAPILLDRQVL